MISSLIMAIALMFSPVFDPVFNPVLNSAEPEITLNPNAEGEAQLQKATFGGGCFWGVEEAFRTLKGVKATAVGYAGGKADNPTYKQVCADVTGHAEVVEVTYNPAEISYDKLLQVFWDLIDPTTLNRQGPDLGTQYRSVIFVHSNEQRLVAQKSKQALAQSGKYSRPIVTTVEPAPKFWRAEEYHQQYLNKRGMGSCHVK